MAFANRPSPEFQRGPENMDTRRQLDDLSLQIRQQHPEEDVVAVTNAARVKRRPNAGLIFPSNRIYDGRMQKYFGQGALKRIEGAVGRMEQLLEGADGKGGLHAQFDAINAGSDPFPAAQAQAIEKMMAALTQPGPDTVGGRNKGAQYLNMSRHGKDANGEPIARYTVNLGSPAKSSEKYASADPRAGLRRNQAFLAEIGRTASPEKALFLRKLMTAMEEYATRVDSRKVAVHDYVRGKKMTPIREEGRALSRLGVVLTSGAAAVLTGIMSVFSGNVSLTPFLYGGLAMYAANPNLLEGRARRSVLQANQLLNSNTVRTYRPEGEQWARVVEQIQQGSPEVKKFLQKQNDVTGDMVLDALAPEGTSPIVRDQLKKMLASGEFRGFAHKVLAVRDPDARELVRNYIELGATKHAA